MSLFQSSLQTALESLASLAALEDELLRAAGIVRACLLSGHKLLVCGNGGSAADGADFSTEFTCRYNGDRRPYPAINLASGGSLLTAVANDYAFDEVFARQVWAFGQPGDVLVATRPAENRATSSAPSRKRGRAGSRASPFSAATAAPAAGLATVDLIVRCEVTARIQEGHKFLAHTLCEQVDEDLRRG